MGVRRIEISTAFVTNALREGFRISDALTPVRDAQVLNVRLRTNPPSIELLVESPSFEGPPSDNYWRAIGNGSWGDFPVFEPVFRVEEGDFLPHVLCDSEDRHGEVPGA